MNVNQSRKGSANGSAKLDEDKVLTIRTSYAAGEATQRDLAARYGVSLMVINSAVRGRTWKHVGGPCGRR